MVVSLLFGLPGDRPGGLVLTVLYFIASGVGALVAGFAYAAVGVTLPRASLPLQVVSALLRGVPLLLLVFLLAHVPWLSTGEAGLTALFLYSFAHVGETLRSFLASYPHYRSEQARIIGLGPVTRVAGIAHAVDAVACLGGIAHALGVIAEGHGRARGPWDRRADDCGEGTQRA